MTETPPRVEHPAPAERVAAGRAARERTPRGAHAQLEPPSDRDPVSQIVAEGVGRVEELLPIRYTRMLTSPFAFYRGTASLMAHDLSTTPNAGLHVQLCGDAHLANFGGFASPDRALVFDLNDFDETLPGPFEWDVKRLATSFEIAGRHRGLTDAERRTLVREVVRIYRTAMRDFAGMTNLQVWYARLDADAVAAELAAARGKADLKQFQRATEKARTKDSNKALAKLTEVVDGELQFISQPPLIVPVEELIDMETERHSFEEMIHELLRGYRRTLQLDRRRLLEQYRFLHLARKVVGVGSVGTRCWMVLMLGKDENDPLVLQVKEASASVLEPYLGKSAFANAGERVVEGQRLMQAASDIFLGWIHNPQTFDGTTRDFYIRQLWDWKVSADLDAGAVEAFPMYARICGWTLARAHARSGDRIAIASYLGKGTAFDRALADFATAYADLAETDYHALERAAADGRLPTAA